jgi:hypothetical protein
MSKLYHETKSLVKLAGREELQPLLATLDVIQESEYTTPNPVGYGHCVSFFCTYNLTVSGKTKELAEREMINRYLTVIETELLVKDDRMKYFPVDPDLRIQSIWQFTGDYKYDIAPDTLDALCSVEVSFLVVMYKPFKETTDAQEN